jgi:hypothetical protein
METDGWVGQRAVAPKKKKKKKKKEEEEAVN